MISFKWLNPEGDSMEAKKTGNNDDGIATMCATFVIGNTIDRFVPD